MRRSKTLPMFLAAALLTLAAGLPLLAAPPASSDQTAPNYDAQTAFDALKGLAGEWSGIVASSPGGEGRETTITYKVSANGHSVIETFAPGKPHEMFSVYHMDGDQLLMTHYCAIGNAPKMRFETSEAPGEMTFAFDGGTNFDPAVDPHAHEGKLKVVDADHLESVAIGFSKGRASSTQYFAMQRVR